MFIFLHSPLEKQKEYKSGKQDMLLVPMCVLAWGCGKRLCHPNRTSLLSPFLPAAAIDSSRQSSTSNSAPH